MNAPVSTPPVVAAEANAGSKKQRTRYLLIAVGIIALLAGGYYGYDWYVHGRFIESTDNAYLRADQVSMAPVVSGQIAEIYISDNQPVTVGQPLVKIDPRRYEMAVREARANVNAQEADVAKSQADLEQQGSVIAQAEADLDNARENSDLAQKDFDRISPLATRGIESAQKSDQAKSALEQAKSVIRLKQAVLDAARQQIASLRAQVEQTRAELIAARESLGKAQIDLDDTVLDLRP
ncbi:biotin/lipoyl-binding protein [Neorhizobium sp. NCHU2750]|uniref:HlyD family secretion protein n=1 Tax=Neorhizobium sp. NCHU2750 TaxID=1825976 RepID=UPI000E72E3C7